MLADAAPIDPERAWAVVATSGTSGQPRLAQLPRAAVGSAVAVVARRTRRLGVRPLGVVPVPAHIGGLLVLPARRAHGLPDHRAGAVRARRAARRTPGRRTRRRWCRRCSSDWSAARPTCRGLGAIVVGGGALDPALRDAAAAPGRPHRLDVREHRDRVAASCTTAWPSRARACGSPPTGPTRSGAIEVAGPTLMDGYRADPAATAEAFAADGWLRTGDLGRVDDGGRLQVRGRADDAIRTGAETVWPDEVEAVLRTAPEGRRRRGRGAARPRVGCPRRRVGRAARPDGPADAGAAPRALPRRTWRGSRRRAMCGSVTTLPRTANGKVRRVDSALTMDEGPSEGGVRSGLQSPGPAEGVGGP